MNKNFLKKAKLRFFGSIAFIDSTRHKIRNLYIHNLINWGRTLYFISGFFSVCILIIEYGFYYPHEWRPIINLTINVVIYILLSYEILAFLFTDFSFRQYLRTHKVEFIIIVLVLIQKTFESDLINVFSAGTVGADETGLVFLSITQMFFLFSNLAHLIRNTKFFEFKRLNPSLVFVSSFAGIIVLGTGLLHLPKATVKAVSSIDIFFIATSATCVTGLASVNISQVFTGTGHFIILLLIQSGGLGIMTLASFFGIFLTGKTSVTEKMLMKDLLSEDSISQVKSLLARITVFTFLIEAVGAVVLYFTLPGNFYDSWHERVFLSVFHAVSAFCNAGFSLFTDGYSSPEIYIAKGWLSMSMLLIILGGLGFPILSQIYDKILHWRNPTIRLTVSGRLVLIMTFLLLFAGSFFFLLLEGNNSLKQLSFLDRIFHSLFYSVTLRTAGFNTIDMTALGETMVFFSLFFMWVGASPVSTGGGVKTSTFAIAILNIWFEIRGKGKVEIFKRTIAQASISRASATIVLSLFVIFIGLFFLTITEDSNFLDLAFETVSAYATVGLSRGVTETLSDWGKLNLSVVMFMGRVGVFNLSLAIIRKSMNTRYIYPNEYVVVN
jgi:Trk-type K+ transport system membrane component